MWPQPAGRLRIAHRKLLLMKFLRPGTKLGESGEKLLGCEIQTKEPHEEIKALGVLTRFQTLKYCVLAKKRLPKKNEGINTAPNSPT